MALGADKRSLESKAKSYLGDALVESWRRMAGSRNTPVKNIGLMPKKVMNRTWGMNLIVSLR